MREWNAEELVSHWWLVVSRQSLAVTGVTGRMALPRARVGQARAPAGSIGESTIVGSNSRPSRTAGPLRQSSLLGRTLRLSPPGHVPRLTTDTAIDQCQITLRLMAYGHGSLAMTVKAARFGGFVRGGSDHNGAEWAGFRADG